MESKNLDIYGHELLPWRRVEEQLESDASHRTYWLATTGRDGPPHLAGVGAIWLDGKVYFVSGASTRKSRDLATKPECALSVSLTDVDLVVEGKAARVTDRLGRRQCQQPPDATARQHR